MRHLIYCVILFVVCSLESCKENKEQLPLFDFGSETFDEPFVGLLSSRPEILVKSLDYPPLLMANVGYCIIFHRIRDRIQRRLY